MKRSYKADLDPNILSNSTFMRTESMKSRMIYDRPLPVSRIASLLGDKAQVNTQRYGGRPYGVGLLIAGIDVSLWACWAIRLASLMLSCRKLGPICTNSLPQEIALITLLCRSEHALNQRKLTLRSTTSLSQSQTLIL
jgi:hypothetical protein